MDMKPENNGMQMASESETTTLSAEKYPELEGAEVGQTVEGNFTGRVISVDNGQVTLQYESLEISTENKADKSLRELSRQAPQGVTIEEDVDL